MRADERFGFNGGAWPPNEEVLAPLRIVDPVALADKPVPERRWLVQDWIPWGTATALYGDGGTGKSLAAQQLMTAAAAGRSWLGLPVTACRTFGVFCEDSEDELHRRQAAINAALEVEFGGLGNMRWVSRVGEDNLLMTFEAPGRGRVTEFFGQVEDAAREFGAQLVVIDTASDTFGGNENVRPEVRQYINSALGRLSRAVDGAVLLCAHPSVRGLSSGEGGGGSTAWNNTVRSRMYLSRPEKEGDIEPDECERILSRKKSNYAARDDGVRLRWVNGVLVPDRPFAGALAGIEAGIAERVFLALLDEFDQAGRPVSDSKNASNYAPRLFAQSPNRQGLRQTDFIRAMNSLFSQQLIVMVPYGRRHDERRKIARAR